MRETSPMKGKTRIPIARPYFDERETVAVAEVLASGWVVQGPKVREFERLFEGFQGCKHAVATTSATTALHLALLCLGIEPHDEILVPAFTHPATANVVSYVGAKPVFVDIELPSFNIDPSEIDRRTTSKTRAIIPVHLFGFPADMDPITDRARHFRLNVVEDAACAHGAEYRGKKAGSIGNCGVFSFHPRKPITTGEGGMLVTHDDAIANRARILRSHGESVSDESRHGAGEVIYPDYEALGFNYRMTDIQAAVGVEQMKKLPHILEERQKIASRYTELLSDLEAEEYCFLPHPPTGCTHSYQSYVILLRERVKQTRDSISHGMQKRGFATRKGTYHVPGTRYYRETFSFKLGDFPNSEMADERSLALPLYAGMEEADIDDIVKNLRGLLMKD
jgi:dTDP-4-amino-4,6-dideoxygalactose transaminase